MTLTLRILNPDLYVEGEEDSVQLFPDFLLRHSCVVILDVGGGGIRDDPLYDDGLSVQFRTVCVLSDIIKSDLHH